MKWATAGIVRLWSILVVKLKSRFSNDKSVSTQKYTVFVLLGCIILAQPYQEMACFSFLTWLTPLSGLVWFGTVGAISQDVTWVSTASCSMFVECFSCCNQSTGCFCSSLWGYLSPDLTVKMHQTLLGRGGAWDAEPSLPAWKPMDGNRGFSARVGTRLNIEDSLFPLKSKFGVREGLGAILKPLIRHQYWKIQRHPLLVKDWSQIEPLLQICPHFLQIRFCKMLCLQFFTIMSVNYPILGAQDFYFCCYAFKQDIKNIEFSVIRIIKMTPDPDWV